MERNASKGSKKETGIEKLERRGRFEHINLELWSAFRYLVVYIRIAKERSVGVREGPDGGQPLAYGGALGRV